MAEAFHSARKRIHALGRDHRSGAAEIAERAAAALLDFIRRSQRPEARQLAILAEATLRAQPAMAPVINLANRVACAAEQGVSPRELQKALAPKLRGFRRALRHSNRKIARQFARRLRPRAVVLTYSYSSTVLAALLAARGKLARVVCSEGRPQLEGRRLAEKLARAGIPVVLVADAALPARVREADAVVVGADAILPGPAAGGAGAYVNKIGTRVLQDAARAARKPFYVLADTTKILPSRMPGYRACGMARLYRPEASGEEKPAAELWRGAPRGVRVENRYFERIPLRREVRLLTERGPLTAAALRRWVGQSPRR
ncbi:MAG: hypothetical protein ACE5H2_06520 [Terriglobia bacterium]